MARTDKYKRRMKRQARVRGKVFGTGDRPRLAVNKSLTNVYVQLIDDEKMITLAMVTSLGKEMASKMTGKTKTEKAAIVGDEIAKKALAKGFKTVAFDRGGNLYHGRVKALAEAARKAGLEF
ncbi:MAG: 50S ribosomal protein L18 [Candidatus Zixiibacteriota bacterium]|nr:MAG: 50S ribosomal protein L18 [candidate division Zixibacteria bacterium]